MIARLLREEAGISIVAAVAALAVMALLGAVAVQEAVSALQRSDRDEATKTSLQAADAAVDAAIFQLNRLDTGGALNIDPLNPSGPLSQTCLATAGSSFAGADLPPTATPDANGRRWCPPVSETAGGTTWEYRVSNVARVAAGGCDGSGTLSLARDIVAVGRTRGTVRRIHARLRASLALLSGAAVQSASATQPMTMAGTARVLGDVQSNHAIQGSGGTPSIAGDAIPGPGDPPRTVGGIAVTGTTTAACQRFSLPAIEPGDVRTSNDNGNWTVDCVTALMVPTPCTQTTTVTSPLGVVTGTTTTTTGGVEWDAAARALRVWGNARLQLGGQRYSLCRLRLEGSATLQLPSSLSVARIFLDDPDECGSVSGAGQVVADGTSRIVNCHAATSPETLQLYALGDEDSTTTQTLAGGAPLSGALLAATCGVALSPGGTPMVLYAPSSRVELAGATEIAGQVAGDVVAMGGAAAVQPVAALVNLNALGAGPVLPLYQPDDYVECTAVGFEDLPENDPTRGC